MTLNPQFAPGCYGSAIAFKKTDLVCTNCPFASQCEPVHLQSKIALQEQFGIVLNKPAPIIKTVPVVVPTVDPIVAISLPEPVQAIIQALNQTGKSVLGALQSGATPFSGREPYLQILGLLLIKLKQPMSRNLIAAAFAQRLGCSDTTAKQQAGYTVLAMLHIGAIHVVDGLITLKDPKRNP